MNRQTTEFKKLEDFLKENNFKYEYFDGIFIVYTDTKDISLIYRKFYDTWIVIESTNDGMKGYYQYLDIIINELSKMKQA